jgi:predicted PurR-regulated permease PerM
MNGEDYRGAMPPMVPSPTPGPPRNAVPVRQVLGIIGLVLAAAAAVELVIKLERIISWLAIAGFFAVVLHGPVNLLQRRLHFPRAVATLVVFLLGIVIVAAAIYSFVRPLVDQANQFINHLPGYVEDARAGRGTVGRLVQRYNLDEWVQRNQDSLRKAAQNAGRPALKVAQSVASGLAALVTILVLTFLMLLQGPDMMRGGLNMLSPPLAERIRRVARDCARAMSGYVAGNLLISVIAAFVTFVSLKILGVPFALVLAIWVAFADLIPLVGATLGAIPTIAVALLHSLAAGIIMLIVFIVYQQFENHVLQVTIMSKTVKLNPLVVLVSVLIGVELYGLLGALLAIPAAGVIQVIARDLYEDRKDRKLTEAATVGPEDLPMPMIKEDPDLPPTREAS